MKHHGGQILAILTGIALCSSTQADWLKGYFAPSAKTDSINRFLVYTDYKDSTYLGMWGGLIPAGKIGGVSAMLACRVKLNNLSVFDDSSFLFLGGNPPSGTSVRAFANLRFWMGNLGDVNHDGYDDFGTIDIPNPNFKLFLGGPGMVDTPVAVIHGINSRIVRAVDIDGDGQLELILADMFQGPVQIYSIHADGTLDSIPRYVIADTETSFGNNLAVGDFNGDGYPDLAVAAYENRTISNGLIPFVKFYWGGPQFDTVADRVISDSSPHWGIIMLPVGDFIGNGYQDLLICGGGDDPYGVYSGGPSLHGGNPDVVVNRRGPGLYYPPTSACAAGDLNHDGHPDIVWGFNDNASFNHWIMIVLGGPRTDSGQDVYLDASLFPPNGYDGMGSVVTGIGDFNGDGIDDFAFYSQTQSGCCWRSQVHFIAGWNANPTDVPIQHDPTVPTKFALHPAYPNPFNPSTTISFDLPKREAVKLTVFDITGRVVRTLLDKQLAAGTHHVTWDGKNEAGHPVASGVYLFRLSTPDYRQTVKGTLLK